MPVSHDAAFGSAAVEMRVLTSEQVSLGGKIQKVLSDLGIAKSLAVIAVEADWMELDQALVLVTGLRRQGIEHPEVKPRPASGADDAVLERLSPSNRKRLETASRTLASLFYARGAGTLALDQGSPAASAPRPVRPAPEPTPVPVRRVQPVAPPPQKSGAIGAIVAVLAAVLAIGAFIATRKKPVEAEPEPPPVATRKPPPPAPRPPPPPPPPKPPTAPPSTIEEADDTPGSKGPAVDSGVEEQRKKYIEELERDAAKAFEEIKKLIAEGRPTSALGKLKRFSVNFGWTEFYKLRKEEIARLMKETEGEVAGAMDEGLDQGPDMSAEGPPLPALAAAFKRLDEGSSADLRRSLSAKTRLAGWKSDLVLRGGKIVKGAEVVDVTREDLRLRGEIDGAKVDLLLAWSALDAASFISVQRQIAKGQGASGLFEMGRAAVLRRLWKDAKAAFEECARADAAWKPRLPDLAAIFSDPALLRGSARRLGDGRLLVEYAFTDADQAGDFTPASGSGGALSVAGGLLKVAAKDASLWTLKDLTLAGDADLGFVFEGSGEASVGFDKAVLHFSSAGLRSDPPGSASPAAAGVPVTIERRDRVLRVRQNGKVLFTGAMPEGPVKPVIGGKGEIALRDFWVSGVADGTEMTRRLGPLERLEGGALSGDFKLDPIAMDGESFTRAAVIEAALDAGQLEEAVTLADEALAKTPGEGLAVAVRGLVRLAQGEVRIAVADADLAMALDPCRGEVVMRARRILGALRGPAAAGAYRRIEAGSWVLHSDAAEERIKPLAALLDESGKRCSATMGDAGPAPKGMAVALFMSAETRFVHLEEAGAGAVSLVDAPGIEGDLIRRAAGAYIRRVFPAAPAWIEAGLAEQVAGDEPGAMKELLPHAGATETLIRKPRRDFRELDRIQSASLIRFLSTGPIRTFIPDVLKKLKGGLPAIEVFSGHDLKKIDADWRAWVAEGR